MAWSCSDCWDYWKDKPEAKNWINPPCNHCIVCGDDGVSHDPRFQRGYWCDVCIAKDDLKEAEKERERKEYEDD